MFRYGLVPVLHLCDEQLDDVWAGVVIVSWVLDDVVRVLLSEVLSGSSRVGLPNLRYSECMGGLTSGISDADLIVNF